MIQQPPKHTVSLAKRHAEADGKPRYIVLTFEGLYIIVDKMPLMGNWWDSDGIRHG